MDLASDVFLPHHRTKWQFALFLIYALALFLLAYKVPRADFGKLLFLFSCCFFISLVVYRWQVRLGVSFRRLVFAALLLRLCLFFSAPGLSDDYFRYFFDGHLLAQHINPYLFSPEISKGMFSQERMQLGEVLFAGMNSKSYFTIYPPLHQGFFFLATFWARSVMDSVLFLRVLLIGFDMANIFLLRRLLDGFGLGAGTLVFYAINPLVILELSGNLHFEGVVLTCLLSGIYFLQRKKIGIPAFFWSLAVGLKLVPLILAPIWLGRLYRPAAFKFFAISGFVLGLLFLPFFERVVLGNFLESFMLFQRKFEFNASVYYFIRHIAMQFIDYNPIRYLVPALNLGALTLILMVAFHSGHKNLGDMVRAMVWIYIVYLLFQPVVHPWYIVPVLGLGILVNEWTPILWSGLIILSYAAYQTVPTEEKPVFILLQYLPLYLFIGYRLLYLRRLLKTGL
jgi:hypothetical protein